MHIFISGYLNSLCKGKGKYHFLAAVLVNLMSACAHTPSTTLPSRVESDRSAVAPGEQFCSNEQSLLNLLELLSDFSRADANDRAAIYERVSTTAVLEPTTVNRLSLAVLKSTPGHHGYNLESAQTLLKAVLNDSSILSTGTVHFARVYAGMISEQRKLAQRNKQLQAELSEAHGKLEALTEIEREVDLPGPEIEDPGLRRQSQPEPNPNPEFKLAPKHDSEPQKNSAGR